MSANVRKFPDVHAASVACGNQILEWLKSAIAERGSASLAISGGSSPKPMFEMFGREAFAWRSVDLFWVDERCVPADDPQSNYRLARESWLAPAQYPEAKIHRVRTELSPDDAARAYVEELRSVLGAEPTFDVIHRGMGADGHTASLFPGSPLTVKQDGIAAAAHVEPPHLPKAQWRVTLLPAVLQAARHTAMLVAGADKVAALTAVLEGTFDPMKYPSQIASREGSKAVWFVA